MVSEHPEWLPVFGTMAYFIRSLQTFRSSGARSGLQVIIAETRVLAFGACVVIVEIVHVLWIGRGKGCQSKDRALVSFAD
jgi:hypothetical protein